MSAPAAFKVVIPARHGSKRLPGKPLLEIQGWPMLRHVYERAKQSGAMEVVVATDDERIEQAAKEFGARVRMTSPDHCSGTERIADAVQQDRDPPDRIIVNVQGDEPLVPAGLARQVAENLAAHPKADVATLCAPIRHDGELFDPNVVKVVLDRDGFALYFSRAPIPWHRDEFASQPNVLPSNSRHYRHIGLYAYRAGYLREYVRRPACELERAERLEQLRVLFAGDSIHVAEACADPGPGVDTPEDLARVRDLMAS